MPEHVAYVKGTFLVATHRPSTYSPSFGNALPPKMETPLVASKYSSKLPEGKLPLDFLIKYQTVKTRARR